MYKSKGEYQIGQKVLMLKNSDTNNESNKEDNVNTMILKHHKTT